MEMVRTLYYQCPASQTVRVIGMGGFKFEATTQPGGLRESSRWSQRSEDHRLGQVRRSHPDGVPDEKRMQDSLLAPLRGATLFRFVPVVFASLQPPATISQPSP